MRTGTNGKATTPDRMTPTPKEHTPTPTLSLHDDAAGTGKREQSEREKAVERLLAKDALAEFHDPGGALAALKPGEVQDAVYALLSCLYRRKWRVYKTNPVCIGCQKEVDAANAAARASLETNGRALAEWISTEARQ